jgi:hypothetical protein
MARRPRYPIYIPSKGRAAVCQTPRCLDAEGTPYRLVVEPLEHDAYAAHFGADRLLTLPFANRGLIAARNWIKDHATAAGQVRHWQLDDNIYRAYRKWGHRKISCPFGVALAVCEDFADRYENVAIAGLNYAWHVVAKDNPPPYYLNVHVYSCSLVLNTIPYRWRSLYNDDTDLCLQVLAGGWCTVLVNAFVVKKVQTLTMKGGNHPIYRGDGRLQMARSLVRRWPGVVSVDRRYRRPQHVVRDAWRGFDTPLRRKADVVIDPTPNDYGLKLRTLKP